MKEGEQKKEYEEASRFKQPQKKAREPCKYRVKNEERSLERNRQLVPVSSISKEKNNGAALPICRREVPTRSPKVSTWGTQEGHLRKRRTRGGHKEDTKRKHGRRGSRGENAKDDGTYIERNVYLTRANKLLRALTNLYPH